MAAVAKRGESLTKAASVKKGGDTMRILVSLIVLTFGFSPAFAALQPLTRAECQKARMHWDDNANVCGAGSAANSAKMMGSAKMGKGSGTQTGPAKTLSHSQKIGQRPRENPTTGQQ
jgi:hypothetical protein